MEGYYFSFYIGSGSYCSDKADEFWKRLRDSFGFTRITAAGDEVRGEIEGYFAFFASQDHCVCLKSYIRAPNI